MNTSKLIYMDTDSLTRIYPDIPPYRLREMKEEVCAHRIEEPPEHPPVRLERRPRITYTPEEVQTLLRVRGCAADIDRLIGLSKGTMTRLRLKHGIKGREGKPVIRSSDLPQLWQLWERRNER